MPRIACGGIPASSSASQATSMNNRCCGSIAAASRGGMAKNSASNSSGCQVERKPPSRLQIVPGTVWSSVNRASASHRSGGTRTMPLRPSRNSSQYCSGLSTPPGNRQPIPTTAIGSVPAFSAISRRALRSSILRSASVMTALRSGVAVVIRFLGVFAKVVPTTRIRKARRRHQRSAGLPSRALLAGRTPDGP